MGGVLGVNKKVIKIRAQKTHCGGEGLYMWRVSCILS